MRVTREKECDIQERNIKTTILTPLMARRDLTPEEQRSLITPEEDLKRNIIVAELFGNNDLPDLYAP